MAYKRRNREFEDRIAMLVRKKVLIQQPSPSQLTLKNQARLGEYFDWGVLLGFLAGLALATFISWATH